MSDIKISDLPAAGAITGAELVPIVQSGSTVQTTASAIGSVPPYLVYSILLNQSGTAAPVATILQNTLGVVPVWNRNSAGWYTTTSAGAFPLAKTFFYLCQMDLTARIIAYSQVPPDSISISVNLISNDSPADDILFYTSFEIRVYP